MFANHRIYLERTLAIVSVIMFIVLIQGCVSCPSQSVKSKTSASSTGGAGDKKVGTAPDAETDFLKIKPTKEAEGFFNAVKGATKVILIDGCEVGLDDREQTPLACFNSDEKLFWDILAALASVTTEGAP